VPAKSPEKWWKHNEVVPIALSTQYLGAMRDNTKIKRIPSMTKARTCIPTKSGGSLPCEKILKDIIQRRCFFSRYKAANLLRKEEERISKMVVQSDGDSMQSIGVLPRDNFVKTPSYVPMRRLQSCWCLH
jgi:hypothetical protein